MVVVHLIFSRPGHRAEFYGVTILKYARSLSSLFLAFTVLLVSPGCDDKPTAPTSAGSASEQQEDIATAYDEPETQVVQELAPLHVSETSADADTDDRIDAKAIELAKTEVQAVFTRIASLMATGDYEKVADYFDIDRLIDEVSAHGTTVGNSRADRQQLISAMRVGIVQSISQGSTFPAGHVRHLRPVTGRDEVVVYTQANDASGYVIKMRWWFSHDGSAWRIYDYEELTFSVRLSVLMSAMFGTINNGKPAPWVIELQKFVNVAALVESEQWDQAQVEIESINFNSAPADLRALRHMLLSSALMGQMKLGEAEEQIVLAEQLTPDSPMVAYSRAILHITDERFDLAMPYIDRYIELLGVDADIYELQMAALEGLGRHDEAVQAGERMVSDNPSAYTVAEFGLVLNESEKTRIGDLIMELGIRPDGFEVIGELYYQNDDIAALREAVRGFKAVDPSGHNTAYYDALVKQEDEQYAAAAETLRSVISQIADPELRQPYLQLYWSTMCQAGKALQAYNEAEAPNSAYAEMASVMYWEDQMEKLLELSLLHINKRNTDPWGHFYAGTCLAAKEGWDQADRHFANAMSRAVDDQTKQTIRIEWVDCLIMAGRWHQVIERVGRDPATLDMVMWHLIDEKDDKSLEALLDTRDQDTPTIGRAYVYSLRGAHAMAADYLIAYHDDLRNEEQIYDFDRLIVNSLVRSERFEEALKHAKVSTEFDGDPYYELVVHIASGEVDKSIQVAQACVDEHYYDQATFYDDDLILEHVGRSRMKAFREKFPPPSDQPATELPITN